MNAIRICGWTQARNWLLANMFRLVDFQNDVSDQALI
jgi:hypothetical protein